MNETKTAPENTPTSSMKMLRAMMGIGILCALLIVLTFEGTLPRIKRLKAAALEEAIFKVLPGTAKTVAFKLDQNNTFVRASSEDKDGQIVYAGYSESGELVGVAIEASGQGYADVIRILYGYDPKSQKVVGFYVLESKETPGLGDKIEKDPDFLANFDALDISLEDDGSAVKNTVVPVKQGAKENPWEVDGITGATISSRAIGNILGISTAFWAPLIHKNQEAFIAQN
ncbi:FMN-binding protein [Fulvivirga sp. M361]|uniref:FMN-binding protein n=1 Tax=Fulvivirga sp. M361 TaxID=2594266 RepID=UPI00117A231B|nr:FMN-binding protein [Fulvivirga sp. M361]TRX49860.1 FMN-binding protein [Fulvivirga sp. M361]